MIFSAKKKQKQSYLNGIRIGLLGLGPRCGTTHIAIAISNYLSETEKKKVFLLENNRQNDIKRLNSMLGARNPEAPFTFHRVTYVPFCPETSVKPALELEGDCVVSDFGFDFKKALSQLRLCDIRIIVGTDGLWRINEYEKLKDAGISSNLTSGWRLFVNLGNVKRMKEKDVFGLEVCCFPFEPDPLYPCEETISFLREAISR